MNNTTTTEVVTDENVRLVVTTTTINPRTFIGLQVDRVMIEERFVHDCSQGVEYWMSGAGVASLINRHEYNVLIGK